MTTLDTLVLGAEFPTPTRDDWEAQVETALKGKRSSSLVTTTADGIEIQPLYTSSPVTPGLPGAAPFTRGSIPEGAVVSGWDVRQYVVADDPATANQVVLHELMSGATSVWLRFDDPDSVAPALGGVLLDATTVALDGGPLSGEVARAYLALVEASGAAPSSIRGSLRLDPVGVLARHGELQVPLDQAQAGMAAMAADVARRFPLMRTVAVDGTVWTDAGGSDADELGGSLSTAVGYLRALVAAGLDIGAALAQIEFTWTATADQFATIAKLRAARRLWNRVAEASGAPSPARGQYQHAVTSAAMLTRRDPTVNLLRNTVACFAAGVGGADAVTVLPFDSALGAADAESRRLARNIHLLAIEESHLARVIDPAGGSHYVETLTDELARAGWAKFQDLERAGGMGDVLVSGAAAEYLAGRWAERRRALVRRKEPLTGVSEFPNIDEAPVVRRAVPPRPGIASPGLAIDPLPLRRLAEPFERLRDYVESIPIRPTVFAANLGPVAVHNTRATWSKNLFEVAGIEVLGNDGFDSAAKAAAAFSSSGARVAVICSSDEVYAEMAIDTARALKTAGAAEVFLAGRPGDSEADLRAAGVDQFVFAGCDVVEALERLLPGLGLEVSP